MNFANTVDKRTFESLPKVSKFAMALGVLVVTCMLIWVCRKITSDTSRVRNADELIL